MKKKYLFMILALGMTAFIFWNSAQPAAESSQESGRLVEVAASLLEHFKFHLDRGIIEMIVRKMAHIAEFAVQAVFIAECFSGKYRKRVIYILFLGLLTACTDEFIQLFPEGRAGLVSDIFIDFSGTGLGTLICGISRRKRRARR
jgi:VanZ family protein